MQLFRTTLLFLLGLALMVGCRSKEGFQATNTAYVYDSKELAPRPEFVIHHLTPDVSRVYYRISSTDLLYMRQTESKTYKANFSVAFNLVASFELTQSLDSGLVNIVDEAPAPPQKALTGYFDINTTQKTEDQKYVLTLKMVDVNRQVEFDNFVRIDKSNIHTKENFLMTDTAGNVIYKNHIPVNVPFLLDYTPKPAAEYVVSYYNRDFPLALPPYSSVNTPAFELDPDSTFTVRADQKLSFSQHGFYHFRLDTNQWHGFTVYSFYDEFPFIAKKEHLGDPLRYLTTKSEYEELAATFGNSAQTKAVVDEFWQERAGSLERSKILIEAFYNRVQLANIFFSSYLEGWKTDRGIIYVIYGPPNRVYSSTAGEAWVYGDEASSLSYYFNFVRVSNPFTNNDYSLERMNSYRYGWGQAIEAWRNGHIYNSKDIKREQDEQQQSQYRQRSPYWY